MRTANLFVVTSSMDLLCAFFIHTLAVISTNDCGILQTIVLLPIYNKFVGKFIAMCCRQKQDLIQDPQKHATAGTGHFEL